MTDSILETPELTSRTEWDLWVGLSIAAIGIFFQYIQLWSGDRTPLTYGLAFLGGILLITLLGWLGFRSKRENGFLDENGDFQKIQRPYYHRSYRWARFGIVLFVVCGAAAGYILYRQQQVLELKIILLITGISGPEPEKYLVSEELITQLKKELSAYSDTMVIGIPDKITDQQGSDYAREVGQQHTADIVVWGSYSIANGKARLSLNVENLNTPKFTGVDGCEYGLPQSDHSNLDSFSLQQDFSGQKNATILFLKGLARYRAGDYEEATIWFYKAVTNPEWNHERISQAVVYAYQGFTFMSQNRSDLAAVGFSEFIRYDSSHWMAYYYRRHIYNCNSEFDKSILDLTQAIQLDPKNALAYNDRGSAYNNKREQDKALADYNQAIQLDPKYAAAYYNRGVTFRNLGDYDQAIAEYTQAIQIDPGYKMAYNNRGALFYNKGEFDKAIDDYNQAIQIDSKYAYAYTNRGNAYNSKGEYDKAIADDTHAIQLDPKFALAYNNRGNAYKNKDMYDEALADYTHAIQIAPGYSNAYTNRANLYLGMGEDDKAIMDATQAIQLDPNLANAYMTRGIIYFNLRDNEKAIADYTQAIRLDPKNDKLLYNRAVAYALIGMNERAIGDLRQALKISTDPQIQAAINSLLNSLLQKPPTNG